MAPHFSDFLSVDPLRTTALKQHFGGKRFAYDEEVETEVRKWLQCCGFWRTDKVKGQVYQRRSRISREINVFYRFEYHMFYVSYPFVTRTLNSAWRYSCDIFFMKLWLTQHSGTRYAFSRIYGANFPTHMFLMKLNDLQHSGTPLRVFPDIWSQFPNQKQFPRKGHAPICSNLPLPPTGRHLHTRVRISSRIQAVAYIS
jgi:hypothetical protein